MFVTVVRDPDVAARIENAGGRIMAIARNNSSSQCSPDGAQRNPGYACLMRCANACAKRSTASQSVYS